MRFCFSFFLIAFILTICTPVAIADDLSSAFERARTIMRDWKPSSSVDSERHRDEDAERVTQSPSVNPPVVTPPPVDPHSADKQRIKKNLEDLNAHLAVAAKNYKISPSIHPPKDTGPNTAIIQQLDSLVSSGDAAAALRASANIRDIALQNARVVQSAISEGKKPPFKALWDFYKYNRPIALGLVPQENRCAIVMSLALGMEPQQQDASLQTLKNKTLRDKLVSTIKRMLHKPLTRPQVGVGDGISEKIYIRAQELALRLNREWGEATYLDGHDAKAFISGKRGVVFMLDAYGEDIPRSGDHIDLWDSDHIASDASMPFEKAAKVWFWEFPEGYTAPAPLK